MKGETVIRWFAVSCVIGGFFRGLMVPLAMAWGMDSVPELIAGVLGTLFMGIGMFGLYLHDIQRWGKLGFAGFALHAIGSFLLMAMVFSTLVLSAYDPAALASDTPPVPIMAAGVAMMPTMMLSMILIGIATLRTKVMPAWPGILLLASPVLNFIPLSLFSNLSPLVWGLSFVWFGIELSKKAARVSSGANSSTGGVSL